MQAYELVKHLGTYSVIVLRFTNRTFLVFVYSMCQAQLLYYFSFVRLFVWSTKL